MSGGTSGGVWVSFAVSVCVSSYEYLSRYIYEQRREGEQSSYLQRGPGYLGERRKSEGARLDRRRVAKVNY